MKVGRTFLFRRSRRAEDQSDIEWLLRIARITMKQASTVLPTPKEV